MGEPAQVSQSGSEIRGRILPQDLLDDVCLACATLPGVLEALQAIVPICDPLKVDELKLKGVPPHYEINAPACSQLSALHRACPGSDHALHDHSGHRLNDHDDHQGQEDDVHHRRHDEHNLQIVENDVAEGRHHFNGNHGKDRDTGDGKEGAFNDRSRNDCHPRSQDGLDDDSGTQVRHNVHTCQASNDFCSGYSRHPRSQDGLDDDSGRKDRRAKDPGSSSSVVR